MATDVVAESIVNDDGLSYELVLPFDTDDPEFVRGFEAGTVWRRLRFDPEPFDTTVGTGNAEMMMRIAEATNREFAGEPCDDDWVHVSFGPGEVDDD